MRDRAPCFRWGARDGTQRRSFSSALSLLARAGNALSWVCPLHNLDYEHYLPIFFDGVRCTEDPYKFMARQVRKVGRRSSAPFLHSPLSPDAQGAHELLEASRGYPERILPCIPSLISPLRLALTTKNAGIVLAALHCIQELVMCNYGVGEVRVRSRAAGRARARLPPRDRMTRSRPLRQAIVPFYRQILSVLNLFFTKRSNLGDQMDYGQWKNEDLGAAVLETLELLEKTGGPHAFINIKYMVPACAFRPARAPRGPRKPHVTPRSAVAPHRRELLHVEVPGGSLSSGLSSCRFEVAAPSSTHI